MDLDNTRELHIVNIEQKLHNWNIPKIASSKIYETGFGFSNIFSHDYVIKTTERSLPVNPQIETLELLDINRLSKFREKYKFVHIGLVQIAIKPLHRIGLDSPILMCLRDGRFNSFLDSLLAVCESNLAGGPVYFNCYPNFTVDLHDANLEKTLTLNIKIPTTMMENSKNVAIIYRVHYKVMKSNITPRARIESGKDSTVLIEANYDHTNVHTPKLINWDQITYPESWSLQEITPPKPIRPRYNPIKIIESDKGHAEITFSRDIGSSSRRTISTPKSPLSHKKQSSLKGVDWEEFIPKAHYTIHTSSQSNKTSPHMSPTKSDMINTEYNTQLK